MRQFAFLFLSTVKQKRKLDFLFSKPPITCSELTIGALEKGVKYVQS